MGLEDVGVRLVAENQAAFFGAMQKASAAGTALGMAIYNAAVMAGKAMINFAGDSITAASDLNETVNKVSVVFGKQSESILKWGENAATSLGMSTNEALAAAGTYGNLFRSMGMTEKSSVDMSKGLVGLAADLGSFNNMASSDVLEKLRAGLTGETEPLKSLGVNISAAAVEAQAMKMHLMGATGELTASAKAQATYALILEQTKLAQGDFINTSDGLANSQKIVAAQFENLKATLGKALLPIVNKVMNAISKLFSNPKIMAGIQGFVDGLGKVIDTFGVFFDNVIGAAADGQGFFASLANGFLAISGGEGILQDIGSALFVVGDFMDGIVSFIQEQGITSFSDLFYALANGFLSISDGEGIFQDIGEALFTVGDTINIVVEWVKTNLFPIFEALFNWMKTNIPIAIQTLSTFWTGTLLPAIQSVWSWMQNTLFPAMTTLWTWLQTNIPLAIQTLSTFWTTTLLPAITSVYDWMQKNLFPIFTTLWNWLQTALPVAGKVLSDFWTYVLQPAIEGVWKILSEVVFPIFQQLFDWLNKTLPGALQSLTDFWTNNAKPVFEAIGGVISGVVGFFVNLAKAIGDALAAFRNWQKANAEGYVTPTSTAGGWTPGGSGFVDTSVPHGTGGMAGGGPVSAGMGYMVGELGPEFFIPKVNGSIIPTKEISHIIGSSLASMTASSSISTTNNYNLSVMTNQNPSVVQQSYRIMQMLAG